MWDFSVIKDLLMNPVYTGAIASQKKDYRFKIGTIGEKKPEDWIVVEGQHEPLIDRMSFDIVQNKLKSRQRPGQTNEISLFAGLGWPDTWRISQSLTSLCRMPSLPEPRIWLRNGKLKNEKGWCAA